IPKDIIAIIIDRIRKSWTKNLIPSNGPKKIITNGIAQSAKASVTFMYAVSTEKKKTKTQKDKQYFNILLPLLLVLIIITKTQIARYARVTIKFFAFGELPQANFSKFKTIPPITATIDKITVNVLFFIL
ncbi:MAG: hypothetical protein GX248_09245, partial [Peptococcaceae bacterium]|nr:hypothetical protein [Peptococcaceae bacterium]